MNLWLIGSGKHAIDYDSVLQQLAVPYAVIGRGEKSADEFERITGTRVTRGGLTNTLITKSSPKSAIISLPVEDLYSAVVQLLGVECKKILVEKPGAIEIDQLRDIQALAYKNNSSVFVAYNRRYYESTRRCREIILDDGGVSSFTFEFTEWSETIEPLKISRKVKQKWVLANSSHVLDLAFHLGGFPRQISTYSKGSLDWHNSGVKYAGAGVTDKNATFSYNADWGAPGRWDLEVMTKNNRLIFKPLEEIKIIQKGSIDSNKLPLDDFLDKRFKPGLYAQVSAFINNDLKYMCTIEEQIKNVELYNKMAGYS